MGGTAAAGTAAALTLALGKAYIGICKSIKMRDLNLDDLSQKKGREAFKQAFRDKMKKKIIRIERGISTNSKRLLTA